MNYVITTSGPLNKASSTGVSPNTGEDVLSPSTNTFITSHHYQSLGGGDIIINSSEETNNNSLQQVLSPLNAGVTSSSHHHHQASPITGGCGSTASLLSPSLPLPSTPCSPLTPSSATDGKKILVSSLV